MPQLSRTTANAGSTASGSPPRSLSPPSTSWSADASPRNSRCSGRSRAPTGSCRPEPMLSTARCATCSPLGIRPWLPTTTKSQLSPWRSEHLPSFDMLPSLAARHDADLGGEQQGGLDSGPGNDQPLPQGMVIVGIDGGYVRNWYDKKRNF